MVKECFLMKTTDLFMRDNLKIAFMMGQENIIGKMVHIMKEIMQGV